MQRPTPEAIRADCRRIAEVADPDDSQERIAEKLPDLTLSKIERRIEAMERESGMEPARPREIHQPERRAGAVARRWRRHCL